HARGHAEAGRLARAVGPEQADDLARLDEEADALDHRPAAVGLHQSVDFQQRHRWSRRKSYCPGGRVSCIFWLNDCGSNGSGGPAGTTGVVGEDAVALLAFCTAFCSAEPVVVSSRTCWPRGVTGFFGPVGSVGGGFAAGGTVGGGLVA